MIRECSEINKVISLDFMELTKNLVTDQFW